MIAGGVPAGAINPNQDDACQFGKPASTDVGTSGNTDRRSFAATASGVMAQDFTCDITIGGLSTTPSICPAIRSFTAGAAPLYGTWVTSRSATYTSKA